MQQNSDHQNQSHFLMLHASATGPRSLKGLADRLASERRTLQLVGLAGYGAQQGAGENGLDPIETSCGQLRTALDAPGLAKRRIVFGHSMGGLIALLGAVQQSKRGTPIDALVLYEPIVHGLLEPDLSEDADALAWDREIITALSTDVANGSVERGVRRFVEAWNDVSWQDMPAPAREPLLAMADGLACETLAMPKHSIAIRQDLAEFDVPTLILRGERSPQFSRLVADRAHTAIASSTLREIAGGGHMAPIFMPEAVGSVIEAFIDAEAPAGGRT